MTYTVITRTGDNLEEAEEKMIEQVSDLVEGRVDGRPWKPHGSIALSVVHVGIDFHDNPILQYTMAQALVTNS